MPSGEAKTYISNPLYTEAMRNFQLGKWDAGFVNLNKLQALFPVDPELTQLRQQMQVKFLVDQDEVHDKRLARQRNFLKYALRIMLVLLFVGAIGWGIYYYSTWIQKQWTDTRINFENEVKQIELSVKYRNAQELLLAGRVSEAIVLFNELADADPNMPGLQDYINRTNDLLILDKKYQEAMQLINDGEYQKALDKLKEIASKEPNYKDITIRIDQLEKSFLYQEILDRADQAYQDGRWYDAIVGYESLRTMDTTYREAIIKKSLFDSYLKAADAILAKPTAKLEDLLLAESYYQKALTLSPRDPEILNKRAEAKTSIEDRLVKGFLFEAQKILNTDADSLSAIQTAESYYSQALNLRPNDPEILLQLTMTRKYLVAIDNFNKGLWDAIIPDLEYIYSQDPNYANGTALQTLYDAYTSRGNEEYLKGDYPGALVDYQRAVVLANDQPQSILRLFEAQLNVAKTLGLLDKYKEATTLYKEALELSGISEKILGIESKTAAALLQAKAYAEKGNYKSAYQIYRDELSDISKFYETIDIVVGSGDYLTLLARLYDSTVSAILAANGINNPNEIGPQTKIKVPRIK